MYTYFWAPVIEVESHTTLIDTLELFTTSVVECLKDEIIFFL